MPRRIPLSSAAYALLVLATDVPAAATFTRVTTGELVTTPAAYWGGAWGDYDDDGWLDLFVGADAASTQNFLYHNNRDGTFTRVPAVAMPKIDSNQHGVAWADYDNDGHLDLVVTAGNPGEKHNALYRNNGDGTLSGIVDGPIFTETRDGGFHAPSWGDYDGDGFIDLFIAGHDVVNRLFRNDGDGSFTRITDSVVATDPATSEGRAWVDYDDDGDLDLFVSNAQFLPNVLYQNDGTGGFTRAPDSGLSDSVEQTSAVCWADYDNDGDLDLYLANAEKNSLYRNDGDGTFSSIADSAVVTDALPGSAISTNCAWADYDNDGFLDLYVNWGDPFATPTTSVVFLFHGEGDGTFARVTEGEIVTRRGGFPAWGDYDNDGFLDLLLSSGAFSVQFSQLYHNDGNGNAWLNVKLVGTVSNRSAIGAKVRVNAFYRGASRWQLREISGGDGQENQQSLNAEFGLADATTIETLRVEWPSGIVQELHDLAPRQFLTVTEPGVRPLCADGIDDDGDGLVDMADPGCPVSFASPEDPQCDDQLDNDGNGLVDFADPKCQPEWPYWESPSCGLGAELALVLPLLGVGRRLATRACSPARALRRRALR